MQYYKITDNNQNNMMFIIYNKMYKYKKDS